MADSQQSTCRLCQYQNPPGIRFCGSCGNLLTTAARGAARRRDSWFERTGKRTVFGRAIGPSGSAGITALSVFLAASFGLWVFTLYRDGRLLWQRAPVAKPVIIAVGHSPIILRPRVGPRHPKRPQPGDTRQLPEPKPPLNENRLPSPAVSIPTTHPEEQPSTRTYPVPETPSQTEVKPLAAPPATAPPVAAPAKRPQTTLNPPPSLDYQSAPPSQEASVPSPQSTIPAAPAPAGQRFPSPQPSEPEISRVPFGARQGDLIWSGQLDKGMLLTIDGLQSSAGSLRGDPLPGVPVQLTLQPADIIVSQAPMSAGAYRRFVLRSPGRRNTVVRVHWETLQ